MSKLINKSAAYATDVLRGIVQTNPQQLRQIEEKRLILRSEVPIEEKVHVVTGGGAGHEPASPALVGPGLLDGVALGEVFTSPPAGHISDLIAECSTESGVLAIIGNYEGDMMNFDAAIEMVSANEDLDVETVVVADDVATKGTERGGRGVCGMVLVCKVAGAKAEQGSDLKAVAEVAQKAADRTATMGVGLEPCTRPGETEPVFDLKTDEVEIGIGNHGEAGVERTQLASAEEITERLVEPIKAELGLSGDSTVATMVNGMGATPPGELYIVNDAVHSHLAAGGIDIAHSWVGNYTTSLDMQGCSVVVMDIDDELSTLLEAPANAPGFVTG